MYCDFTEGRASVETLSASAIFAGLYRPVSQWKQLKLRLC
jgi:hypothetical protein